MLNSSDPWTLFTQYRNEAIAKNVDPCPAVLATVSATHQPSARIILIREFDTRGFVFYTHKASHKGRDLQYTPKAALCFYWQATDRQIRIEGEVVEVSTEESDLYFASRVIGSQVNALISKQSDKLESYEDFFQLHLNTKEQLTDKIINRPEHWTGFRIVPTYFEFWQDGIDRCHKRQSFIKTNLGLWFMELLYP